MLRALALTAASLLIAFPCFGWTAAAEGRISSKAVSLAPPDLAMILERFKDEFARGRVEGERDHRSHRDPRALQPALDREIREAVAAPRARGGMVQLAERLGRVAHLVADANQPFNSSGVSERLQPSRNDFESYFDRRMHLFPTVFYGLEPSFDTARYVSESQRRNAKYAALLDEEYFRGGSRRSSEEFDDRSTAFGVAALSYSHAVSDLVNIFYYVWKEAGGDVRTATVLRRGNLLIDGASTATTTPEERPIGGTSKFDPVPQKREP